MANKGNSLPLKFYKQMLKESFLKSCVEGNTIKNYLSKNNDPILQKTDRYITPRTKGNILTEEYVKKMANKPEKSHIKRIPLKHHLTSFLKVVENPVKREGIKINPKIRML